MKVYGATPKSGLVRGHDKPIHGSCAIYFPGGIYLGTPHPVTVNTRISPFLIGNPYQPSFVTALLVSLTYILLFTWLSTTSQVLVPGVLKGSCNPISPLGPAAACFLFFLPLRISRDLKSLVGTGDSIQPQLPHWKNAF